jgi:DNA-binding FrmR family transcriptional regulator
MKGVVINMKKNCENCTRSKHRTEGEKKDLNRRLKIIAGQINGLQQMIDDDRYCDDVLLQVASATNALKSFGNEVLKSHMKSCMVEDITNGKLEVIDDILDLVGKLK